MTTTMITSARNERECDALFGNQAAQARDDEAETSAALLLGNMFPHHDTAFLRDLCRRAPSSVLREFDDVNDLTTALVAWVMEEHMVLLVTAKGVVMGTEMEPPSYQEEGWRQDLDWAGGSLLHEQNKNDEMIALALQQQMEEEESEDDERSARLAADLQRLVQQQEEEMEVERAEKEKESAGLAAALQCMQEEEEEEEAEGAKSLSVALHFMEQEEKLKFETESLNLAAALKSMEEEEEAESARSLAAALHTMEKEAEQESEAESESLAAALQSMEEEDSAKLAESAHRRDQVRDQNASRSTVMQMLTPRQCAAMEHVRTRARRAHLNALPHLQQRVQRLGFSNEQLERFLYNVEENAPIVVHFPLSVLEKLTNDTHYRNLFEIGRSCGSSNQQIRSIWEDAMFGMAYNNATPFERPKYGCVNVAGDVIGCPRARSTYGELFLVLAPSVRHRTTFAEADTGGFSEASGRILATNEYYAHVLHKYSDTELSHVLGRGLIAEAYSDSSSISTYKEVQIHGPLRLAVDVQALSLPHKYEDATSQMKEQVEIFQQMSNCNVIWAGDLLSETY